MAIQEKYKTGNYICVSRWNINDELYMNNEQWNINKNPTFNDFDVVEYKLIHKKHEHILNAYLLDSDVEIEYKSLLIEEWIDDTCDFINVYAEHVEYRLKESKHPNLGICSADEATKATKAISDAFSGTIKQLTILNKHIHTKEDYSIEWSNGIFTLIMKDNKSNALDYIGNTYTTKIHKRDFENIENTETHRVSIKDPEKLLYNHFLKIEHDKTEKEPETIQAPNSEVKFLKPEFDIEFLANDGYVFLASVQYGHNRKANCVYGHDGVCYEIDTSTLKLERWTKKDLTLYQEPKEWYEDSNYLNKLICCEELNKMYFFTGFSDGLIYVNDSDDHFLTSDVRPATNEEIDSLKIDNDAN